MSNLLPCCRVGLGTFCLICDATLLRLCALGALSGSPRRTQFAPPLRRAGSLSMGPDISERPECICPFGCESRQMTSTQYKMENQGFSAPSVCKKLSILYRHRGGREEGQIVRLLLAPAQHALGPVCTIGYKLRCGSNACPKAARKLVLPAVSAERAGC